MAIDDETTVTAKDLGKVLGVSARRVRQLHEEGIFERPERGRYPLVASVQAYIAGIEAQSEPEALKAARLELLKTQRRRIEQTIRDREAVGRELDWQDAMVRAITFECQMRVRLMAPWLWTELASKAEGEQEKLLREACHLLNGWSAGIRRQLEQAFLGAARIARRKQVHLDNWARVVQYAQLAAQQGEDYGDDSRDDSGNEGAAA